MEKLLNTEEASAYLGIKVATLQNWKDKGLEPGHIKVKGCIFYSTEDLDKINTELAVFKKEQEILSKVWNCHTGLPYDENALFRPELNVNQ